MKNTVENKDLSRNNGNTMLAEVICYLYGHKVTDNDYDVCDRCKRHAYYDSDWNRGQLFFKMKNFFKWKIYMAKQWYKRVVLKELPF